MEHTDYPAILTKENFWNELNEKYPVEMKRFCEWIDGYKKRVNWDHIFVNKDLCSNCMPVIPKFHEIPVAMQIGIFFQYTTEVEHKRPFFFWESTETMVDFIRCITDWFRFNDKP